MQGRALPTGDLEPLRLQPFVLGKRALGFLSSQKCKFTHSYANSFQSVSNLAFHSVLFPSCRTALRLGEDRGPSVRDVLCRVSLSPRFLFSQMCFPRYRAIWGSPQRRLCAPPPSAGRVFREGLRGEGLSLPHRGRIQREAAADDESLWALTTPSTEGGRWRAVE